MGEKTRKGPPRKGGKRPALPPEAAEENRQLKWFRFACDVTFQRLHVEAMTLSEAREAVEELRKMSEIMFPGKGGVFDLVVAPRMERVIRERWGEKAGRARLH